MARPARLEVGGFARADALQELQRRVEGSVTRRAPAARNGGYAARHGPACMAASTGRRRAARGRRRSLDAAPAARTTTSRLIGFWLIRRRPCRPTPAPARAPSAPACRPLRPTASRTGRGRPAARSVPVTATGTLPPEIAPEVEHAAARDSPLAERLEVDRRHAAHRAVAEHASRAGSETPSGRYGRPRNTNQELTSSSVTSVRRAPGAGAAARRAA